MMIFLDIISPHGRASLKSVTFTPTVCGPFNGDWLHQLAGCYNLDFMLDLGRIPLLLKPRIPVADAIHWAMLEMIQEYVQSVKGAQFHFTIRGASVRGLKPSQPIVLDPPEAALQQEAARRFGPGCHKE
jgi:hypothetical protein